MYLHIGGEYIIKQEDIVGIFDIENSTISAITREYLKEKEKRGKIFIVNEDMPKSFIILKKCSTYCIYFTSISSATLKKRMEGNMEQGRNENGGTDDKQQQLQ
jgi:extracellular matrix regulatory protein B